MEPGAQFKFNRKDKSQVEMLRTAAGNDELAIYPGGLMSTGMKASPQIEAQKNSKSKPAAKAVAKKKKAPESKIERAVNPKKKVPGFLSKARAAEDEARKRGDL